MDSYFHNLDLHVDCDLFNDSSSQGKVGITYNAMLTLNVSLRLIFIIVATCDFHKNKNIYN